MLFGTYKLKNPESVHRALKSGYSGLDCASIYNNEKEIGKILQKNGWTSAKKRDKIWIQSKIWRSIPPEEYGQLLKKTLKNLQVDFLDCWLLHWPGPGRLLYRSPVRYRNGEKIAVKAPTIPKTWTPNFRFRCYSALVHSMDTSQVKSIGVCNYSPELLQQLIQYCKKEKLPYPSVVQNEYHPLLQNRKLFALCKKYSIKFQAFGLMHSEVLQSQSVSRLAERLHVTVPSVLLSWIKGQGIIPIIRSENMEHQLENVKSYRRPIPMAYLSTLNKIKQSPGANILLTWQREQDPASYL